MKESADDEHYSCLGRHGVVVEGMENGVGAGDRPSLHRAAEESVPFEWVDCKVSISVSIKYDHMFSVPRTITR